MVTQFAFYSSLMKVRITVLLAVLALLAGAEMDGAVKKKKKRPARKQTVSKVVAPFNAARINTPLTGDVKPDANGDAIVRAQILLDRAHFSPGEIDGHYGDNLHVAVVGFQKHRKLEPTGTVDARMWQLLNADPELPLVSYTVTAEDSAGPFEPIPDDMAAKAKLKKLDYESAAEGLGEKFHIDPKLLIALNPKKKLKAGEQIMVPNVQRDKIVPAAKVVVTKSTRTVSAIAANGTLLAQYPATIGSEHDPLPIGDWKILAVERQPWFNYNPALFWDAKPADAKARIAPGPNNPVGEVWIALSKPHYGIHGTPEPSGIGHAESHGCIRLTNWDVLELSRMVKAGTPAILVEDEAAMPGPAAPAPVPVAASLPPPTEAMVTPIDGLKLADLHDSFDAGRTGHTHEAIDIMEPRGTPVHAVVDGTIAKLFNSKAGGTTIYQFDHTGEYCYYYAHLDRYADQLAEGQRVTRGDVIGFVGSTGNASPDAPHLHFTIFKLGPEKKWWQGTAINPYSRLKGLIQPAN